MCLIVILRDVLPDAPLVIAANRDELYARRSSPAMVLHTDPTVVGGRDEVAGGTWMAITPLGFIVAVTNHRPGRRPHRDRQSRGSLVVEAAKLGSTTAIDDLLANTPARTYNEFNLLYGSAAGVRIAHVRDDCLDIVNVPTGVHALPNAHLNQDTPRVARARSLAATAGGLSDLGVVLADHQLPDDVHGIEQATGAICIHTTDFGTRSAAIVALDHGVTRAYWFADGPPCTSSLADVTSLITR